MLLDGELSSIERLIVSDDEPVPMRIVSCPTNPCDETFV
jgi:hypothetical protein